MSFFGLFGKKKYKDVNGEELRKLIKEDKDLIIIDVRSSSEFKLGHIKKAKHMEVQALDKKISELSKYKDKNILLYCASGMRSSRGAKILSEEGFNNIYNLKGGINSYKGTLV